MRTEAVVITVALAVAGCNRTPEPAVTTSVSVPIPSERLAARGVSAAQVQHGAAVYAKNCAVCHGARAEGAKDWHRPGADGKYPPPPLDGSAHAWHHPRAQLKQIIMDGTLPRGGMPAWRGKLSDADVDTVIVWFQSLWPDDIYRAWRKLDATTR